MSPERIPHQAYQAADRAAENAIVRLLSRFAMLASVPLLGWILVSADNVRTTQISMRIELNELQQQLVAQMNNAYSNGQATQFIAFQHDRDAQQDADRAALAARVGGLESRVFNGK